MLGQLRRFWRTFSALLFALAIAYVPADIAGLPDALTPIRRMLAIFDQQTALWIFCFALIAAIAIMDARPIFRKIRAGEITPPWAPLKVQFSSQFDGNFTIGCIGRAREAKRAKNLNLNMLATRDARNVVVRVAVTTLEDYMDGRRAWRPECVIDFARFEFLERGAQIRPVVGFLNRKSAENGAPECLRFIYCRDGSSIKMLPHGQILRVTVHVYSGWLKYSRSILVVDRDDEWSTPIAVSASMINDLEDMSFMGKQFKLGKELILSPDERREFDGER